MSDETQMWILRKLHVMDVENPVNLEEVCGYLKDEKWKVNLVDLGYYRVEIHWDKGECRTVRRVIKSGRESKGERAEELLLTGKSRGGREVLYTLCGTEE